MSCTLPMYICVGLGRALAHPYEMKRVVAAASGSLLFFRRTAVCPPPDRGLCIEMAAAARNGFRRLFSVSAFAPPPPPAARPAAEPCNNLFVSGLNKRTTSEKLKETFSKFGQVMEARVVTDRISGYSRGFGFVKYTTVEEAGEAIKGMDGKFLDGWVIFAEYAKQREAQQSAPSTPPPGYQ